ncbi:collar tail protein for L-shaped tail fibre attachment [Pectobacterium phage My1]|uniref:Putative phage tail protein 2 n=1 Tax=Pectobacterium phage My1 TaxID=1204539 RepID=J9QNY8_9CAUD|nr:collar tail protein for L-shaped tail fibre attachment [Pectobacterium phage My1]AFQ22287.1 putative phage tail protein 2 [Pectobacterium phage My1]
MTENKTLDLIVDQNVPFGLVLQFQEDDGTVSDLTGFTLRGSIKKELEDASTLTIYGLRMVM